MNTDVQWEKWGKKDPYFGVVTHEKFRSQSLTEEAKVEFFESGRDNVKFVLEICRSHFDQGFSPKKILDFGCGVGRLVIPFAEIAEHVVGLDVSDSMLNEARKNCSAHSVQNVSLLKSDDKLSSLDGKFDLIHSVIVFQHIPIERGRRIFTLLLDYLKERGICAVQITYSKAAFKDSLGVPPVGLPLKILKNKLKKFFSRVLISGSSDQDPGVQMNSYNLNELFFLIQSAGIQNIYAEFTDHGGELGVYLYFQRPNVT